MVTTGDPDTCSRLLLRPPVTPTRVGRTGAPPKHLRTQKCRERCLRAQRAKQKQDLSSGDVPASGSDPSARPPACFSGPSVRVPREDAEQLTAGAWGPLGSAPVPLLEDFRHKGVGDVTQSVGRNWRCPGPSQERTLTHSLGFLHLKPTLTAPLQTGTRPPHPRHRRTSHRRLRNWLLLSAPRVPAGSGSLCPVQAAAGPTTGPQVSVPLDRLPVSVAMPHTEGTPSILRGPILPALVTSGASTPSSTVPCHLAGASLVRCHVCRSLTAPSRLERLKAKGTPEPALWLPCPCTGQHLPSDVLTSGTPACGLLPGTERPSQAGPGDAEQSSSAGAKDACPGRTLLAAGGRGP